MDLPKRSYNGTMVSAGESWWKLSIMLWCFVIAIYILYTELRLYMNLSIAAFNIGFSSNLIRFTHKFVSVKPLEDFIKFLKYDIAELTASKF